MNTTGTDTHALVLSGGAAYAAYEVGVMKALFLGDSPATAYTPLRPSILTGTSAGAFNAAVLLSGDKDLASAIGQLEEVWTLQMARPSGECANSVLRFRLSPLNFLPACLTANPLRPFWQAAEDTAFFARDWFSRGVAFLRSSEDVNQRFFELVDVGTLVSAQPLMQLIESAVRLEEIRQSSVQLRIAVANWRTGIVRFFDNAQMSTDVGHLAVQASISVPGLLHSVQIEGQPYVDAAVVMNTPLKSAIDAGAETIHVIYLNPEVQDIPLSDIPNTSGEIYRALVIGFAFALNRDIEIARRINLGTSLLKKGTLGRQPSADDLKGFSLVADHSRKAQSPYRQITIHRYQPQKDLGGIFRWFSFERNYVTDLIEGGFADAVEHDCKKNGCVLPN
jgi:predicted acylesterase/phospholipase RssA